jgi:hypothetical protein
LNRATVAIVVLVTLLLGSNLWWAFKVLDGGVSYTYLRASHDSAAELLVQMRAVLDVLTQKSASRSEVLTAVQSAASGATPYEKLGNTWVGQLGLKFNEQGRLSHIITSEQEAK